MIEQPIIHEQSWFPCAKCGASRINSSFFVDGTFFFMHTCVDCDSPAPDEPFADTCDQSPHGTHVWAMCCHNDSPRHMHDGVDGPCSDHAACVYCHTDARNSAA